MTKKDPIINAVPSADEDDFNFGKKDESTSSAEELASEEQAKIYAVTAKKEAGEELSEEEYAILFEKTPPELSEEEKTAAAEEETKKEEKLNSLLEKKKAGEELSEEELEIIEANSKQDEEDFFAAEEEVKTDKGTGAKLSFKEIADDFELELESDSKEEFIEKINKKIEDSRQEFNLDNYNESAKKIIKHVQENNGDIKSFFQNETINSFQAVKALPAEDKVRNVMLDELLAKNTPKDEAQQEVDEKISAMSTRQVKDISDNLDAQADKLINQEIENIIGKQEEVVQKRDKDLNEKKEKENKKMISFVKEQTNFLGIPISEKATSSIERDIKNGIFDKAVDSGSEEVKFAAYMISKYGIDKISKKLNIAVDEKSRASYNKAIEKSISKLHKVPTSTTKTGHQSQSDNSNSSFAGFRGGID